MYIYVYIYIFMGQSEFTAGGKDAVWPLHDIATTNIGWYITLGPEIFFYFEAFVHESIIPFIPRPHALLTLL